MTTCSHRRSTEAARPFGQPFVALAEGAEKPHVALFHVLRQPALDTCVERTPAGGAAQQHQRVVGDANEGRREHGHERLVVVAVLQEPQVREQVDHLLAAVVVAACRAEGRQIERAQLLLVQARVGTGGKEEDDLARRGLAGVDDLAQPPRDVLRLGLAPVDAGVRIRRLVGDEQLDRGAEGRVGEAAGRGQRLERGAEVGGEQVVDDLEHLWPRAVVLRQGEHPAGLLAPLAEDLDVGVAEAVDRLELVADEEQLLAGEQVDRIALEAVRVLELVDHDRAQPPRSRSRISAFPTSRSRAYSWRSSKSSAESLSLAAR